ncbi:hypothetical protein NC652_039461 [Populus alba x Populus x berolinensis]|nr:hypothetical protein NC652_039461 [Populus alba x Populus x berolinensis]
MAAIFKKKHIPNKCCPEVTKFSKFCYHALGLFVATTPDFILTVPEFFERTQKVYDHCLRVVQSPSKLRRGEEFMINAPPPAVLPVDGAPGLAHRLARHWLAR